MSIFTREFASAAAERAIKTTAQTGAAIITAAGVGLIDADWVGIASVSGMAGLVSVLTSVGSGIAVGGPSLTSERLTSPRDERGRFRRAIGD